MEICWKICFLNIYDETLTKSMISLTRRMRYFVDIRRIWWWKKLNVYRTLTKRDKSSNSYTCPWINQIIENPIWPPCITSCLRMICHQRRMESQTLRDHSRLNICKWNPKRLPIEIYIAIYLILEALIYGIYRLYYMFYCWLVLISTKIQATVV